MGALASPKTYAALAAFQAVDAVACGVQVAPIKKTLGALGVPDNIRPVLPVVKTAAAVRLLSVTRFPALARLTTAKGPDRSRPRGNLRVCPHRSMSGV